MRYQAYESHTGYDVVRNAAQLNELKRKNHRREDRSHPPSYPAIVREYTDRCDEPYYEYTTVADCEQMLEALTMKPPTKAHKPHSLASAGQQRCCRNDAGFLQPSCRNGAQNEFAAEAAIPVSTGKADLPRD